MLGYGGQWVNNTSKFIGGVQTWVSIDVKINYIRFTDVACSRLGINWSYNYVKIYMQNPNISSEFLYLLKDDYDIWIMIRISRAHTRNLLFLSMVTSLKEVITNYEQQHSKAQSRV